MKLLTKDSPYFQNVLLLSFLALLTLTVVAQANPILRLPGRDNGTYLYIGDQILKGKLPYLDVWEHKPPGIFYLNALGLWLGRGSRLGIWLLEFVTIFLAALFGYVSLRKRWGNQAALFGTFIWFHGLNLTLEGGNLTEEYSLPFSFLAILVFLYAIEKPETRIPDFLLGALFGINFIFRPNNTTTQLALVLTLIFLGLIRRDYRIVVFRLGAMAVGLLAALLVPVLYFWQKDALIELYKAAIVFNFTYSNAAMVGGADPIRVGFGILQASAWIALLGLVTSAFFLIQSIRMDKTVPPVNLFLIICSLVIVPLTDPARRTYSHYYMTWLPLIGVSSGYLYSVLQTKLLARISFFNENQVRDNLAAVVLSVLLLISSGAGTSYLRAYEQASTNATLVSGRRSPLSRYVNNHTDPGELVYFWGGFPGENFMSRRDSPTPYLYYSLYLESDLSNEINHAFLQDLMARPPVLIVDMDYQKALSFDPDTRAAQLSSGVDLPYLPKNLQAVYDFIEKNYALEDVVYGKKIYRRIGTN